MEIGPIKRVPLFINRYSLSPRTSMGIQTVRLMDPYPDWLHFHWRTNTLKRLDPRSVLVENIVVGRWSFLHRQEVSRACGRLGVSPWNGSDLRSSLAKRLMTQYRERVSSAYVAPLSEDDAIRCVKLANLVGVPFVLHLWDVLQGDLSRGALRELVDRAESIFCVSQPLLDEVSLIRGGAEFLSFSRDASLSRAVPPENGPLKIVLHGNSIQYANGLDDLDEAIGLLEPRGLAVEVSSLGTLRTLRRTNTSLKRRVNVRGFSPSQQEVDQELSRAHVAFLPGPKSDPKRDLRSRYSIPSRILDYMAVGLPIVGAVHKASATAVYVQKLGLDSSICCSGPEEIADWLHRLARPEHWAEQSARSRNAFDLLQRQEAPAQKLKRALDKIS